jgi:hypothetical protein
MIRGALALVWLVAIGCPASGQSGAALFGTWSRPTAEGAGGMQIPDTLPGFEESGKVGLLRHKDFAGKPCLLVNGLAQPQIIDPNLYDDVITVTNNCPQRIAMQVCYYQSEDCIPMDVPGYGRKEAILGTLPSTTGFRFEFREKL